MFSPKPGPRSHARRDARAQHNRATIHLNADGRHFAPSRKKEKTEQKKTEDKPQQEQVRDWSRTTWEASGRTELDRARAGRERERGEGAGIKAGRVGYNLPALACARFNPEHRAGGRSPWHGEWFKPTLKQSQRRTHMHNIIACVEVKLLLFK